MEAGTTRAGKQGQKRQSNESDSKKLGWSTQTIILRHTYSLWPRDDGFSRVGQFGVVISVFLQQSLNRQMKQYLTTQNRTAHTQRDWINLSLISKQENILRSILQRKCALYRGFNKYSDMSTFSKKNYQCNTHTHDTLICETRA